MSNSAPVVGSATTILFVGNSYTFGRVDPVMSYNAANVHDLTAPVPGTSFTSTNGTNAFEPHPWGGVPGIFKAFTDQAGIAYDVSLSARNAATLQGHYTNSNPGGWDLRGNIASKPWDTVVLQENSTQALPSGAGSITFAAGSATATLSIDPTPDTKVELDENVAIQITAGSGYRVVTAAAVSGVILNDDPTGPVVNPALPTVTLVANPSAVPEDGTGKIVYTFTRTGPTTSALVINFDATRDGSNAPSVGTNPSVVDFENFTSLFANSFASGGGSTTGSLSFTNGGSVTIKAGASTATLTMDPKADTNIETDESLYLTLKASANYNVGTPGQVQGTILNDDYAAGTDLSLPGITLALPTTTVYEDGSANLIYTFTRTGPTTNALTVNFDVDGTATLPGNDFTVSGANSFSTGGAAGPDAVSFRTYAGKIADYVHIGAADGSIPANPNANAAAQVWLEETWSRPNLVVGALVSTTDPTTGAVTVYPTSAAEYYASIDTMTADLKAAYDGLAAANAAFKGVAPVGEAFLAAVLDGTAMRNPYAPTPGKVDLWWDDNLHASKYGSYLAGVTLFGKLTGLDPRSLGAAEHVAADLGITIAEAGALQRVAAATLGLTTEGSWTSPGQVTELRGTTIGTLVSQGAFGFSDPDSSDSHTVSATALTPGALGALVARVWTDTTGDGTGGAIDWTYTVDNTRVESLAAGQTRVESFLVSIHDQHGGVATQQVDVTINGTYDIPVTIALASDTGSSATDGLTSIATLRGGGEAFAAVALSLDGVAANVVADATGAWSYAPRGLADGPHTVTAAEANGAGDTGMASFAFTLDTAAPDAPVLARAAVGTIAGTALTIAGTAEALSLVAVTIDGVAVSTATANAGGAWSLTLAGGVAAGTHALAATATDAAGNVSAAAAGSIAAVAGVASGTVLAGGAGSDVLDASGTGAAIIAVLRGGDGNDTMLGGAGNDRFSGDAGADSMAGGGGNDQFFGTLDKVFGGPRDSIDGGAGADELILVVGSPLLTAAVKAEIAALSAYLLAGVPGAHFVSDVFHLDVWNLETARVRLDGTLLALTDAALI